MVNAASANAYDEMTRGRRRIVERGNALIYTPHKQHSRECRPAGNRTGVLKRATTTAAYLGRARFRGVRAGGPKCRRPRTARSPAVDNNR